MRIFLLLLITMFGAGCEQAAAPPLPKPLSAKELVVVTHNGPNTYYVNGENEYVGLECDLAKLFVKEFGEDYSIKFLVVDNITKVIPTLLKGQAHFAAADLSITELRQHLVQFSTPYDNTQQLVVYNKELQSNPKSLEDFIGKRIAVPAGTSYAERLGDIKQKEPRLTWREPTNKSADELMEQVADGSLDYTVADAHLIALLQNYYPNLGAGMPLGKPEKIAWAFPKNGDPMLLRKANAFLERVKKDGTLRNLIDRYYGHAERLNPVDITTFLQRTRSLLPRYSPIFKQAQEATNIDWRLLAAIALGQAEYIAH